MLIGLPFVAVVLGCRALAFRLLVPIWREAPEKTREARSRLAQR